MDPKSGKPLRLFVNPFAMWADLAVKSGAAMLTSAQAAIARANTPRVAVLPAADAPPRKQAMPRSKATKKNRRAETAPPARGAKRSRPRRRR